MAGLQQAGFEGASVLEIGSGVGHLHQTLLEQGAANATGIDLAPAMTELAEAWAGERGLAERTQYLTGDFIELAEQLPPADVTVLDKVVCCYPDADGLLHRSLAKTEKIYALTYPRQRWVVRLGAAALAVAMWVLRSEYRAYVHDPDQIEAWICDAGFKKLYQSTTPIWLTQVYVRP